MNEYKYIFFHKYNTRFMNLAAANYKLVFQRKTFKSILSNVTKCMLTLRI